MPRVSIGCAAVTCGFLILILELTRYAGIAALEKKAVLKIFPLPANLCLSGVFGTCVDVPSNPSELFSALVGTCGKSCTLLDVGANRGEFIKSALHLAPLARIVAFEPHPLLSEALARRYKDLPNVRIVNAGLSVSRGILPATIDYAAISEYQAVRFVRSCKDAALSFGGRNKTCKNIEVVRLDDEINFKVNIMKIDVQGHELDVLLGGYTHLQKFGYDVIVTELSPSLFQSESHARLYLKLLATAGYRLFAMSSVTPQFKTQVLDLSPAGEDLDEWPEIRTMRKNGAWMDVLCINTQILR